MEPEKFSCTLDYKYVKTVLQVVIGVYAVVEEKLLTGLMEVEGILSAKPLGYVYLDVVDPDPVTPRVLLIGWQNASLLQVFYLVTDALTRLAADYFWL